MNAVTAYKNSVSRLGLAVSQDKEEVKMSGMKG
jgi:hypothetical protein